MLLTNNILSVDALCYEVNAVMSEGVRELLDGLYDDVDGMTSLRAQFEVTSINDVR